MADLRVQRVMAGIVSAGLALGVAELLAAFMGPERAPLAALGNTVVDHTPDGLREWAISTFGTNDKTVLYLCMAAVAIMVAAGAGAIERTTRAAGSILLALFGLLAAVIAADRTGLAGAIPTVIGIAAGIYALRALTWRIDEAAESMAPESSSAAIGASGRTPGAGSPTSSADPASTAQNDHAATQSTDLSVAATPPGPTVRSVQARTDDAGRTGLGAATTPERRQVLRGLAMTGGLAVLAGVGGRLLGAQRHDVSGERAGVQLPEPIEPQAPLAPGVDLRLPGLTPYVTSNTDFYRIDTALIVPQVSIDDWSLRIHGMVDREIHITWADLANRTAVESLVTLACVSNPVGGDLIGNARWRGYRLDALLAEAGPHPDADMVLSHSIDGFTAGSPLAVLTDGRDALLAVGMNGEPLPVAHGYPARLVVPGLYGYVSATKWVTELEVTRFDRATAYWTRRGWSAYGPIKTESRIDTPRSRARIKAGPTPIAGVAWAQHRGIRAVELQIDNGDWQPARLSTEQSIDTWRQWVYDWNAIPGTHTLRARATDGTGETQTADRRDVVPDGATGYPTITVQVS
ncbi:molybdopterin-dependent oxidoreductase [Nocardia sp. NBC_01009]|uniref:molybdopterin-dependent oxidoreductase n=1 Tax=Nocardia sp. NBC_01009 TaxID=2975996 RepID=UPI00386E73CC|nr:molybdopterin-dependent oxidoreductase [Nocardia sp. NBC_01009]